MKGKRVMMMKKKTTSGNCVTLDKIIGITSRNNNAIAVNPQYPEIAYIASGVVAFFSPITNKQEYYIFNQNSKIFSCLAFSANGKYLATGEGTCKQPEIAIWEFVAPKQLVLIKRLKGHKYGVEWVAFSPDAQHLVSLGNEHDKGMFVWNWSQEKRISSNKITKRILSIAFSLSGDFFITGGVKNIKMWSFDKGKPVTTSSSATAETKCMASKNVDLAEMKEKTFCSVAVSKDNIFALTQDGVLCVFTLERAMDKWMDLHAGSGYVLTTLGKYLLCGCSDGIIRCFDAESLEHIVTLPRPPPLGQANISPDKKRMVIPSEPNSQFADTTGLLLFDNNTKLFAIYSDRTVFTWDISKLECITVYRASLHHSAGINQIQILPTSSIEVTKFVTASSDKTIRFWHLCHSDPKRHDSDIVRNVYSRELSRIIYVTRSYEHFKQAIPEGEGCIKCIACSPDGKHIASGDTEGIFRVHSTETLEELLTMQAHDSDIVALDYNTHTPREGESDKGRMLLASGSRDRLMHIFDAESDYKPILTIDDHNSSISDLTFVRVDNTDKLISCGADRSLVFRTIQGNMATRYFQTIQKSKKCYSIQPHPIHKTIVIGEDKSLKVLLIDSGKLVKEIEEYQEKGVKALSDSNLKVAMDCSGLILAVCNLDRTVRLIEYYSGKVLGKLNVGEIVTSLAFSNNGKKLLTTTNDGCIFIWRLSLDLTNAIRARMAHAPIPKPIEIDDIPERPKPMQEELKQELVKIHEEPGIRCHESIMPSWAKAEPPPPDKKKSPFDMAEDPTPIPGKWGKTPLKIEFDDPPFDVQKIEVFKSVDEIDSEDDKKVDDTPVGALVSPEPKMRESFVVTKSQAFSKLNVKEVEEVKDEEIREEPTVDDLGNDIEDDEEEDKLPELEPEGTFVKNPLRNSLSSSFWQKKQEEKHVEQAGFFKYEPVDVEPWYVPKIGNVRKKKEIGEVQTHIDDMKSKLQGIGVLSMPKRKLPKPEPEKSNEITSSPSNDIPEEIIEDIPESIPEDIGTDDSPKISKKEEPKKNEINKFDSPCIKESLSTNKSKVDYTISESVSMHSVRLPKNEYKQTFLSLKKSLEDVSEYLNSLDTSDPEYSASLEESAQERKDIMKLLVNISGQIGEPLSLYRESDLLEKYSKKLVSAFEKKMRKREKRDREKKQDRQKERENEVE